MNTFWLKIAAATVLVVAGIVAVTVVVPSGPKKPKPPKPPEKTFYDQADEDKAKFLAKPVPLENHQQTPAPTRQEPAENKSQAVTPVEPAVAAPKPAQPTVIYCKPLSEIDDIQAERLLNVAVPDRSIGRLPMTGFKLMVDCCRQILEKWPDSWYAYRAHQLLADMPVRFRERYHITKEELDMSRFYVPRPGTKPFTVKESR
jgi:hypothetical protein